MVFSVKKTERRDIMLGARIAKLRQSAGMSQAELAKRINVSVSAVGMYEQGRREPAGDVLIALARELGVTTDYLLTGIPDLRGISSTACSAIGHATRQELVVMMAAMLIDS